MPGAQLHFLPTRVEGLPDVTAVTIFPDRIEFDCARDVVTHRFADIARWPRPRRLWKLLYRFGVKPGFLPVADRDWFHPRGVRVFEFYTVPPVKICMPPEQDKADYGSSLFVGVQNVLREGGFATFDLG